MVHDLLNRWMTVKSSVHGWTQFFLDCSHEKKLKSTLMHTKTCTYQDRTVRLFDSWISFRCLSLFFFSFCLFFYLSSSFNICILSLISKFVFIFVRFMYSRHGMLWLRKFGHARSHSNVYITKAQKQFFNKCNLHSNNVKMYSYFNFSAFIMDCEQQAKCDQFFSLPSIHCMLNLAYNTPCTAITFQFNWPNQEILLENDSKVQHK